MVSVGEELEPFTVTLTLQRLVMEAAANRDFAPLHHDTAYATASGVPAASANTTMIETLLEATLRHWAGLDARITMIDFSMMAFNVVGDVIVTSARVTDVDGLDIALDVWLTGPRGITVTGRAAVRLAQ